jgi:hypothetical protein
MPTLFLLAPHSKTQPGTHRKDCYTIVANGVGPDYGISTNLIQQVTTGMPVIVFDRDRRLQAEGTVSHVLFVGSRPGPDFLCRMYRWLARSLAAAGTAGRNLVPESARDTQRRSACGN